MASKLSAKNFQAVHVTTRSGDQISMNVNIDGPVFVFFKLMNCKLCNSLIPIFNQIATQETRISCYIMDLSNNQDIIRMSRESTTRIDAVPYFVIYMNGKPYAKFTGTERNASSLSAFITNTLNSWQKEQSFVAHNTNQQPTPTQSYTPSQNFQQPRPQQQQQPPQSNHPSMKQCDPNDKDCIQLPGNVIPHNMPWESDFRKYMEYGKI